MTFSVIIPTYNRSKFIAGAVDSVLSQSYRDFELIVIDDGSTDDTEETIRLFNDKRLVYVRTANSERGAARNYGTRISKGEYVTFLDSDDKLYKDHLLTAKKFIEEHNKPFLVHLNYEIIDDNGKRLRRDVPSMPLNQSLLEGNHLSCAGVFVERNTALNNLFDEDRKLAGLEDWELWLRLAPQFEFCFNEAVTSALVQHGNRSVINSKAEDLIEKIELLITKVKANKSITGFYKESINRFYSSAYSYLSLHLALTKKAKKSAVKYLFRSLAFNFKSLFSRRTLAIIKHLIV